MQSMRSIATDRLRPDVLRHAHKAGFWTPTGGRTPAGRQRVSETDAAAVRVADELVRLGLPVREALRAINVVQRVLTGRLPRACPAAVFPVDGRPRVHDFVPPTERKALRAEGARVIPLDEVLA